MDLDGRTRQFFSVLSERLKEKGATVEEEFRESTNCR